MDWSGGTGKSARLHPFSVIQTLFTLGQRGLLMARMSARKDFDSHRASASGTVAHANMVTQVDGLAPGRRHWGRRKIPKHCWWWLKPQRAHRADLGGHPVSFRIMPLL